MEQAHPPAAERSENGVSYVPHATHTGGGEPVEHAFCSSDAVTISPSGSLDLSNI